MLEILCTEELNIPFNNLEDAIEFGETLKRTNISTWYSIIPSDDLEPELVMDIINKFGRVM